MVSYLLLVPFYLTTAIQTPRGWRLGHPAEFASFPEATVLFLTPDGTEVRGFRLDGSDEKIVLGVGDGTPRWAFLRLEGSPDGQKLALSVIDSITHGKWSPELTPRTLARFEATPPATRPYWDHGTVLPGTIRDPVDFRADARVPWAPRRRETDRWEVWAPPMPSRGLWARRPSTGEVVRVAVDVPGASWAASGATVLPGDQVVFQLGDQVMLADLNTKRLGPLARGRSPVVLWHDPSAPVTTPTTTTAPAPATQRLTWEDGTGGDETGTDGS